MSRWRERDDDRRLDETAEQTRIRVERDLEVDREEERNLRALDRSVEETERRRFRYCTSECTTCRHESQGALPGSVCAVCSSIGRQSLMLPPGSIEEADRIMEEKATS